MENSWSANTLRHMGIRGLKSEEKISKVRKKKRGAVSQTKELKRGMSQKRGTAHSCTPTSPPPPRTGSKHEGQLHRNRMKEGGETQQIK